MPLVTLDGMPRADHDCCLYGIGSINTPTCMIRRQREIIMGKRKGDDINDSPPGACSGRSLLEMLEDSLDEVVDILKGPMDHTYGDVEVATLKGKAQGFAESIAIIRNPYYPNVTAVRAESVERWEWREKVRDCKTEEALEEVEEVEAR